MAQSVGGIGSWPDSVLQGGRGRAQLLRGARWAAIGFFVGLALCVAYIVAQTQRFEQHHADRFLPGTLISGVEVGGMTEQQALQTVSGTVDAQLDRTIRLAHAGRSWDTTPRQLGSTSDVSSAVSEAMSASRRVGWTGLFRIRWLDDKVGFQRGVAVSHDEGPVRGLVDRLASEINVAPRDASLSIAGGQLQVVKEQPGRAVATQET
ncbi:MAG: peptidoglycan binding domain-containing protein, partial [Gemmatimonadales bacterium]